MAGSGRRIALTSQGSRLGSQGHAAVFPAGRRRVRQRHPATAFLRPFGPGRVWGRTQGSVRSTLGYDPVLTGDMVNKTYRLHGEQLSNGNIERQQCFYALERNTRHGSTHAVHLRLESRSGIEDRAMPPLRHSTPHRLQNGALATPASNTRRWTRSSTAASTRHSRNQALSRNSSRVVVPYCRSSNRARGGRAHSQNPR